MLTNPTVSEDGWATVSDSTGQLLFYFNNNFVYDRTHTVMPQSQIRAFGGVGQVIGGIGSAGSSYAAECIAVPWPQNPGQYFLFSSNVIYGSSLSDTASVIFFRVNLALRGGLGDVDASSRRQVLHINTLSMIQAVRHANGRDYWVLTHESNTNLYHAYAVTPAGVNPIPVISAAGSTPNRSGTGFTRLAPNGRMIAYLNSYNLADGTVVEDLDLVQFDATTGQCRSYLTVPGAGGKFAEFSPDSKLLYVSGQFYRASNRIKLKQYDLSMGSAATLLASGQWLGPVRPNDASEPAQMQLGPDGRLYIGRQDVDSLSYIAHPNRRGAASALRLNGVWMGPPLTRPSGNAILRTSFRLPTFVSSFLYPADFTASGACQGDSVHVRLRNAQRLDSVRWHFGDPSRPGGGTSTRRPDAAYRYAQPGTYRVRVQVYYDDFSTDTLSQLVTVRALPSVRLPADTVVCGGQPTVLTQKGLSAGITAYRWSTGATTPTLSVSQPGTYTLTVTNTAGCTATARAVLTLVSAPVGLVGPIDTTACLGSIVHLRVRPSAASGPVVAVRWPDGSSGPTYAVDTPGTYAATVTLAGGCEYTLAVPVRFEECPDQLTVPNIITPNGDRKNEAFVVPGLAPRMWRLEIYSRWGQAVYDRPAYTNGEWNAAGLAAGVYFYRLSRTGYSLKGWIEVVR